MVVMDSTTLMLLFHPEAKPPVDPATGKPLEKCAERIELLLLDLSETGTQVMVPTPVLSEILVVSGPDKARILSEITNTYAFKLQPFDEMAAIEVAMMTELDGSAIQKLDLVESKAKVKYDRQILAIAKANGVKTIYSDDVKLASKAASHGIAVVKTHELPAPPEPPQAELPLPAPPSN